MVWYLINSKHCDNPISGKWQYCRWDSNPQHPPYESGALPIKLRQYLTFLFSKPFNYCRDYTKHNEKDG